MEQDNWSNASQVNPTHFLGRRCKDVPHSYTRVRGEWAPPVVYVVRIREAGSGKWSHGFETPFTSCNFVDLKPDTEYELEVRAKNDYGESEATRARGRTDPSGGLSHFMPWLHR
ncbi:MAG: fibronectin type III domain-containing protein [Chloroflexi bacterium]|nr:fibronectin type III domain-containing protein [Chloroflexota bacterium]